MKAVVVAVGVAFLASTCWYGRTRPPQEPPAPEAPPLERVPVAPDLGQRAYRHTANLVAFGPRHTGSPGWRQALDYIAGELTKSGLEPVRDRWTDAAEGLAFENVIVTIPGEVPDKVVIGAHHDTKKTTGHSDPTHNYHFVGANDSGSGVGLLLALAGELAGRPSRTTVELVFFDGEESIPYAWDRDRALFGSRRYVDAYTESRRRDPVTPAIRAFVLLDMVGARDLSIDDEGNSDPVLRAIIRRAARACGHEEYFFRNEQTVSDDHLPFLAAGIASVDLIDIADNPQWHTAEDTLEHISPRSLQIVGEVVLTALPEIQRRFVLRPANLRLPGGR